MTRAIVVIDGHIGLDYIHIKPLLICQVLHAVPANKLRVTPAAQGIAEPAVVGIALPYDGAVSAVNDALSRV